MDDDAFNDDFEPDTMMRLAICEWVNDMAERAHSQGSGAFDTPDQFLAAARDLEHYITKGATIAFECAPKLNKTVSGR